MFGVGQDYDTEYFYLWISFIWFMTLEHPKMNFFHSFVMRFFHGLIQNVEFGAVLTV